MVRDAVGGDVALVRDHHDGQPALAAAAGRRSPSPRGWSRCRGCRSARRPAAPTGSLTSARAIATRCCCPPESWLGWCSARSVSPTASSAVHGPAPALGGLDHALPRVEQRQLDVLDRRGARQQIEALEHEADGLVPDARELVGRQRRDIAAVHQDTAARRPIQAPEDVHERRLARTRRPDDGDELAGVDAERDAAQRVHEMIADVVVLGRGRAFRASGISCVGGLRRRRRELAGKRIEPSPRRSSPLPPCRRPCRRLRSRNTRWPHARGRRGRRRRRRSARP